MLRRLIIHDVVLIDKLAVDFARGLNVLSGETGAGKSILLDALALALGARSDAGLVREGAAQASVTATFDGKLSGALRALFDGQGLSSGDGEIVLRRTVARDGKSRAFVNDQPIGVTLLRQIGETLLEVHGQFETHGLLNPSTHRGLLDAFAEAAKLKKETAAAFKTWQEAVAAHARAQEARKRAEEEEDFLRAAVFELDQLAPEEGELDRLAAQRTQLQNREKILENLQTAESALSNERGAAAALTLAGKALARIQDKSSAVAEILAIADRALNETEETAQAIARLAREMDADPNALGKIEDRFFKLRGVARKHGVAAEALQELHENLRARLSMIVDQGETLAALAKQAMESRVVYEKRAKELSAKRKAAAEKMAKEVKNELPPLRLERAVFAVEVSPLPEEQWGPEGMDRIAFLAAPNPGQSPAPLHKVASGGELARFMLALKVVLAKADLIPTLVFDEVDTGIGGATASAVGERLAALSRDVQVLVVTHSPQVAARAGHHLRVEKETKAKKTITSVVELNRAARIEEIARMLAGSETTDAARKAALSLLDDAKKSAKKGKA